MPCGPIKFNGIFVLFYRLETIKKLPKTENMKLPNVRFGVRTLVFIMLLFACTLSALAYPSGSPAGYTGSPGDTHHCTSCHGGSATTVSGWITSDIPASGYMAGVTYNITATVSGTGKKGMEVSPQNIAGTQLGILTAGSNSHLVGGTKYVTQNSSGSTSSTVIYNFTWTAPVAGTGEVTFYGAFTVGKSTTKLSTLVVNENAILPLTAEVTASPGTLCAGETSQLNVIPAGGSGAYTYSWSSVPAGFSSSLPNPIVTPSVTTQYIAHVSDGVQTVDPGTEVIVVQPATTLAGNDTTCVYTATELSLNGSASNYTQVEWSTSGTGTFSAATALTGLYFLSLADRNSGSVTLTLTATPATPCTAAVSDSRIITIDAPTGFEEEQGKINVVIAPNPSHGLFSVIFSGDEDGRVVINITDATGRVAAQNTTGEGNKEARFDLSAHPKGMYLVKVQTENKSLVRKLVID